MTNVTDDYSQWVGRTEIVEDDVSLATADAAAATFDEKLCQFSIGAELPPLWHWFYFLPKASQSTLGSDGHPQREGNRFMPPIPYPRRMFAGARLKWHRPLAVGQPARREAVIRKVVQKSGRSGALAFVTVSYRIYQELVARLRVPTEPHIERAGYDLCIEEEQDIVYREPGPPLEPPEPIELPPVPDGTWSRLVIPDTRMLFRFSALTFNAHRIHYDRSYAMHEEGYPGLVVHGPLTAMLLLQLVRSNTSRPIAAFSFRGQSPLFDLSPFRLVASPSNAHIELEAQGPDGKTTMTATAELQ
jgi:3-methylfumaryl-CoA hydratase